MKTLNFFPTISNFKNGKFDMVRKNCFFKLFTLVENTFSIKTQTFKSLSFFHKMRNAKNFSNIFIRSAKRRTLRPSVHPSATRRSGEAEKWRSGKVEKRSSGLDVRFSAWTKSFATQRQMVSFASAERVQRRVQRRKSGNALTMSSAWTKSSASHLFAEDFVLAV
jgi:hypothetical protein